MCGVIAGSHRLGLWFRHIAGSIIYCSGVRRTVNNRSRFLAPDPKSIPNFARLLGVPSRSSRIFIRPRWDPLVSRRGGGELAAVYRPGLIARKFLQIDLFLFPAVSWRDFESFSPLPCNIVSASRRGFQVQFNTLTHLHPRSKCEADFINQRCAVFQAFN